ncbi:MAG: YbaB/EbfC family nucleoid-associated protein [Acidobacteria bacterium]|nr:YbaB/EbfC family nucleoid-associated protein [Acidobacteriota bacterium]MBI3657474.1 YbaB/EbfC family nucleoid-associated protein [Acidobacteriota bacterium]
MGVRAMNINQMMKQAQKQMEKVQEQMAQLVVEASSGGGMVTVKMSGAKEMLGITIEPEAIGANDVEMLQDLIVAAVNEATRKVDEELSAHLGPMSKGFKLPGL